MSISRQHVIMSNHIIINPMIKHPLSTTALNDKTIDGLHKSIPPTIISGMLYSFRWPKELRYGLHCHCSLKLQHLGFKQLLCKVSSIHKFINHNEYRNLFTTMIDSYQLVSDISNPILGNSQRNV